MTSYRATAATLVVLACLLGAIATPITEADISVDVDHSSNVKDFVEINDSVSEREGVAERKEVERELQLGSVVEFTDGQVKVNSFHPDWVHVFGRNGEVII